MPPRTPIGNVRHRQGFLLLEATLTTVVIAVGLVFISRGMGASLKALSALQQYDRLLRLAESQLNVLQGQGQAGVPVVAPHGTFEGANQDIEWELAVENVQSKEIPQAMWPALCEVTVSVHPVHTPTPVVRLATLWPNPGPDPCH